MAVGSRDTFVDNSRVGGQVYSAVRCIDGVILKEAYISTFLSLVVG